ncbi:unnamed protein product, partial [Effrenium voratum]
MGIGQERTESSLVADVEVFNSQGQLAARLEGASCRKAENLQDKDASDDYLRLWLPGYDVQWKDVTVVGDAEEAAKNAVDGPALVVCGDSGARGERSWPSAWVWMRTAGDPKKPSVVPSVEEAIAQMQAEKRNGDISSLNSKWSNDSETGAAVVALEAAGPQLDALQQALQLLQAEQKPRVLLATGGAQPPEMTDAARHVTCLDLDGCDWATRKNPPLGHWPAVENDLAQRGDQVLAARLARSAQSAKRPMRLHMPRRGSLTNLRVLPQPLGRVLDLGHEPQRTKRPQMKPGEVEVRVEAIGLNFRDVLNAVMGMYPGDPGDPGLDCSGTAPRREAVVNVEDAGNKGAEFSKLKCGLRCGDDAFGIVWGCLKTYAATPWQLLVPRPGNCSAASAAALPTVYTTVDVAFAELAKLKKGEKVLIHAATGGVGLVAVQYAQRLGAEVRIGRWEVDAQEVYTTAGREEKRQHLRDLGVKFITSSRNGAVAERKGPHVRQGSDGIHVVLNSLSHDNFIGRSLSLLAKGGRFVEIGKRDVWSVDEVAKFRSDVKYYPLAIDGVCENEPDRYQGLLKRLEKDLQGANLVGLAVNIGSWKPLAATEFEGLAKGVEALQFLQRAQQIGKAPGAGVVLTLPRRMALESSSVVLSGGMGALGL